MNDDELRLMRLAPLRAVRKGLVTHIVDDKEYVAMSRRDFEALIKHFLSIIPIDEQAYLKTDPVLAEGVKTGRFNFTASKHFIEHGYLEGRRPLLEYFPEDYDFHAALRPLPRSFHAAMYRSAQALAGFDYKLAERYLREALAICPESYQANRLFGILLSRTNRPLQARTYLNAAVERYDGDFEIRLRLASVCQALFLPDERARHLRRVFELRGENAMDHAAALAGALGDLGQINEARRIFLALGPSIRGGDEIAAQRHIGQTFANVREDFRALVRQARRAPLSIDEQIDLADRLGRLGFRKAAGRRINSIMAGLRGGRSLPSADSFIRLIEATRISKGLEASVRALDSPHVSNARTITCAVDLLYRSQDLARLARLQNSETMAGGSEIGLRCLILAAIQSRDFEAALGHCRTWRKNAPTSTGWAAMVMLTLSEKGEVSFVRVPKAEGDLPVEGISESPIPKRIAQFWNDDEPPADVRKSMATWVENNPSFEYQRFSDRTGRIFVQTHFDASALEAYDFCQHAAMRGDYFRLAYLAVMGGIFIDADERNMLPLSVGLSGCGGRSLMLVCNERMIFFASPIATVARHPLIVAMFEAARDALLAGKQQGRKLDSWQATGPGIITGVAAGQLLAGEDQRARLLADIAIVNAADSARISQEESFDYKRDPVRNWRLQSR